MSIRTQDVLLMLAMTYMLGRGLREVKRLPSLSLTISLILIYSQSNYLLVLPWIMLSMWNMYNVHYSSLLKMGLVLKQTRTLAKLPWVALTIDLLGLGKNYTQAAPEIIVYE